MAKHRAPDAPRDRRDAVMAAIAFAILVCGFAVVVLALFSAVGPQDHHTPTVAEYQAGLVDNQAGGR
jgi:NADH:ubiquinone oxidoreductase subunit 3 (subunit A)